MHLDRLDPVTLITGAGSSIGAACARTLARRSQGGLILVDADEAALTAAADALDRAPERVSMLPFDARDEGRWAQAMDFIRNQYGRIDWAVVHAAPGYAATDLVDWGDASPKLNGAPTTLAAVAPLICANLQGGGVVITASGETLSCGLTEFVRATAREGAPNNLRTNAMVFNAAGADAWPSLPWFKEIAAKAGGDAAALEQVATLAAPMARFAAADDPMRMIALMLSDEVAASGATLAVDGGYTI